MKMEISFFKKIYLASKNFLLARKALVFIFIGLIALAYLVATFYLYAWRIQSGVQVPQKISIDPTLYQKVMENIGQRELNFEQEASQNYPDPFIK